MHGQCKDATKYTSDFISHFLGSGWSKVIEFSDRVFSILRFK